MAQEEHKLVEGQCDISGATQHLTSENQALSLLWSSVSNGEGPTEKEITGVRMEGKGGVFQCICGYTN
jgi:hypothetical protein